MLLKRQILCDRFLKKEANNKTASFIDVLKSGDCVCEVSIFKSQNPRQNFSPKFAESSTKFKFVRNANLIKFLLLFGKK